jgi:hypothetical protein
MKRLVKLANSLGMGLINLWLVSVIARGVCECFGERGELDESRAHISQHGGVKRIFTALVYTRRALKL